MVDLDISKIKRKKPKIAVSLSLDKENVDYIRAIIEKEEPNGLTLSAVFDDVLDGVVTALKRKAEERSKKNEGVEEDDKKEKE